MAEEVQTRVRSVMDDPSVMQIARVYASAFLDAAKSTVGVDAALEEGQSFVDDVLSKNAEFERLLVSPMTNRDDKLKLIDRVVAGRGSDFFVNFLRVLARHDRLDILPAVLQAARIANERQSGRKRVSVRTAKPLSNESREAIVQRLKSAFAFDPILEAVIDPSLIGGMVIRVDDTIYDSSLRTRLKQLRSRLRERSLHEIQTGRNRFSHPEGD
ncbi:MAG: F-type H+-transporting ATPase subunit delta [Planctomycetota bacterium]|nr:MAG: F-type H+-transporting ATPase subunit delta [Planctomycetota bacterium]